MDTRDYKGISRIRDTYPGTPDTVTESYISKGEQIQLTGKFPQNFIRFDTVDLSDIKVPDIQTAPNISFRFIVRFKSTPGGRSTPDGQGATIEEWTSQFFLNDLIKAQQENNPYFTKEKITIATVDFSYLSKYWEKSEFRIPELYANVEITDTITTKEDMLQHINWMVSGQENLRPVQEFGNWIVSLTDSLGLEYSDQIEAINRGEVITNRISDNNRSNTNTDSDRGDSSTTSPRNDDTTVGDRSGESESDRGSGTQATPRSSTTTIPIRTQSSSVNTNYTPFNTAGRYTGETRSSSSGLYIWADGKWNPM